MLRKGRDILPEDLELYDDDVYDDELPESVPYERFKGCFLNVHYGQLAELSRYRCVSSGTAEAAAFLGARYSPDSPARAPTLTA